MTDPKMIDLDLTDLSDETLRTATGDDYTDAVYRAASTGRGHPPGSDWTFDLPILRDEVVKADGREWPLRKGDVLRFEPARTVVIPRRRRAAVDIVKQTEEDRYTLSAWYIPDTLDAHNEWTDPATLQKAAWGYMRKGNRTVHLQHDRATVAGEVVEMMTMPQEWRVSKSNGAEVTYPAGTVFAGVVWEPWAWQLVKSGQVRGLSIGGRAARVPTG